ncbi:sugar ABC transporter permease [Paenibacillus sp. MZ04-78.2]|uniref:carbohydrate ABC transporter permease n=1 Tax=Paenibacillus sp. MZ04-78.2 TaxID=2962034 RepID=UPI0020B7A823|nr:sugar ABC transporter permease [Paenibacillus sp. MZ04-78.2]MCP3776592.1 sugar ABC transporter permease [Paenibacillus sp. MZ04-78.2]
MKRWRKFGEPLAILYLLPALIPLTAFWFIPMGYVVYLSMMEWDFMSPEKLFVGFDNYTALLENPDFYRSLRVTFTFAAGTIVPTMIGGLLLALLLHGKLAGSPMYRAILFSPWVTPTVAVSIVWSWIFEPRVGLANSLLSGFVPGGLPWLQSETWAMAAVIIVTFWKGVGWTMVFYLVALQSVPIELQEASRLDGSNRFQTFYRVTLPLISPITFFLSIVLVIDSLQAYDQINILTQGGPAGSTRTILYFFYQAAFERFQVGEASAVIVVLVLLCVTFSLVSIWISRKKVHYLA